MRNLILEYDRIYGALTLFVIKNFLVCGCSEGFVRDGYNGHCMKPENCQHLINKPISLPISYEEPEKTNNVLFENLILFRQILEEAK